MSRFTHHTKRVMIAITGGSIVLIGIIAIPYPGPGWLIVFAGLAVLATEFTWAQRLLERLHLYYDQWTDWLKRQPAVVRIAVMSLTGIMVVLTVWLMNGYGVLHSWLHLNNPWLNSPFTTD